MVNRNPPNQQRWIFGNIAIYASNYAVAKKVYQSISREASQLERMGVYALNNGDRAAWVRLQKVEKDATGNDGNTSPAGFKKQEARLMNQAYQDKNGTQGGDGASEEAPEDGYDPGLLLNTLLEKLHLKEDAELAKKLRMDKALLEKIRNRQLQISGSMLMLMQEATGIAVTELRQILNDRRTTSRMTYKLNQRR